MFALFQSSYSNSDSILPQNQKMNLFCPKNCITTYNLEIRLDEQILIRKNMNNAWSEMITCTLCLTLYCIFFLGSYNICGYLNSQLSQIIWGYSNHVHSIPLTITILDVEQFNLLISTQRLLVYLK